MTEIEVLRKNVYDLQKQLREAYEKVKELRTENIALRKQIGLLPEENSGC